MDDAGVSAYMIARAYLSSGTALYIRNVMVVDLTAAYGAGNEPTAAWMESHIPYFTGTYEILELHPGDTFSPSEDMTLYAAWGRVKPSLSPNPVGTGESVLVSVEVEEP